MNLKNAMLLPLMVAVSACGGSAQAETVSIKCEASQGWQAPAMTLVYEGSDTGTLTAEERVRRDGAAGVEGDCGRRSATMAKSKAQPAYARRDRPRC